MNKYGTLAHEYGHFFDDKTEFNGLHFKEIEAVKKATGLATIFKNVASSSDEFFTAMRSDNVHIKRIMTADAKADLIAHNTSSGVQGAIDGLFTNSIINSKDSPFEGIAKNNCNGSSGRNESSILCCHEAIHIIVLLLTAASGLKPKSYKIFLEILEVVK